MLPVHPFLQLIISGVCSIFVPKNCGCSHTHYTVMLVLITLSIQVVVFDFVVDKFLKCHDLYSNPSCTVDPLEGFPFENPNEVSGSFSLPLPPLPCFS